jgi:hypothetical protein
MSWTYERREYEKKWRREHQDRIRELKREYRKRRREKLNIPPSEKQGEDLEKKIDSVTPEPLHPEACTTKSSPKSSVVQSGLNLPLRESFG